MLIHSDLFKKFNYKDDKPRAVVSSSATADELQEIVSQAIWGNQNKIAILTTIISLMTKFCFILITLSVVFVFHLFFFWIIESSW